MDMTYIGLFGALGPFQKKGVVFIGRFKAGPLNNACLGFSEDCKRLMENSAKSSTVVGTPHGTVKEGKS